MKRITIVFVCMVMLLSLSVFGCTSVEDNIRSYFIDHRYEKLEEYSYGPTYESSAAVHHMGGRSGYYGDNPETSTYDEPSATVLNVLGGDFYGDDPNTTAYDSIGQHGTRMAYYKCLSDNLYKLEDWSDGFDGCKYSFQTGRDALNEIRYVNCNKQIEDKVEVIFPDEFGIVDFSRVKIDESATALLFTPDCYEIVGFDLKFLPDSCRTIYTYALSFEYDEERIKVWGSKNYFGDHLTVYWYGLTSIVTDKYSESARRKLNEITPILLPEPKSITINFDMNIVD